MHYPLRRGELLVRHDGDWDRDLAPGRVDPGRSTFEFELGDGEPYRYYKPVIRDGETLSWAQGENFLALRGRRTAHAFPYFAPDSRCHVCDVHTVPSSFDARGYDVRVFLPPGYDENTLQRFPALYMQDGPNLFFPDEAYAGVHWRVSETLTLLDSMNLIRQLVVVGVYPRDRMREYTAPGYGSYVAFLAGELKPWVDGHYRTSPEPADTAVLGSSLGGVVSLYAGWERPDAFGKVGCMSSTFGYRDDLFERVCREAKRPLRIYLDSGWPRDNYEVTRSMRAALRLRGYRPGRELLYVAFPEGRHAEDSWASRMHLPLQFFWGEDAPSAPPVRPLQPHFPEVA